jgi:hypothetical protein
VGCAGVLPCGLDVTLRAGGKVLATKARTISAGKTATFVFRLAGARLQTATRAGKVRIMIAPLGPSAGGGIARTLPVHVRKNHRT